MKPSLFLRVVGVEARRRMAYRADFWLQAFAVFGAEVALAWFLWRALFSESGAAFIAGWDLETTVCYYVGAILVAKLVRGNDVDTDSVSNDIYEGALNRYALYPASYFGLKYAQRTGALLPAAVQFVLFGGLAAFLLHGTGVHVTAASVAMGVVSIAVGNLLYLLMTWPLHALAFWADNVWSLLVALRFVSGILGGLMLPLGTFPAWSRPVVDALPFRQCFAAPIETLLGRVAPQAWLGNLAVAAAWAAGFWLVGRIVFRRGEVRYSGIGI